MVASAALVAVTVTTGCPVMEAGAVYRPVLSMLPVPAGLMDHVTAVLALFVTVALNCCVCPTGRALLVGFTLTPIAPVVNVLWKKFITFPATSVTLNTSNTIKVFAGSG